MQRKHALLLPVFAFLCCLVFFLIACSQENNMGQSSTPEKSTENFSLPPSVEEIKWEQLIPKDWNPYLTLERIGVDKRKDNDPQAREILAKIRAEWDKAPVVKELNGKKIRLSGYVVVLEGDENGTTEFLLVPFYGSCIHVPPPPSNQVVHVIAEEPAPAAVMFNSVWVMGTLTTVQSQTGLASAGYQIKQAKVGDLSFQK